MKNNNENHYHSKYLSCERCSIHILNIIYFLQIVKNHNASFILEEKVVKIRLISEYSFQWYQLIIDSFVDNFSDFFRLNSVVFHLRSFQELFSMRMSQHSPSVQKRLAALRMPSRIIAGQEDTRTSKKSCVQASNYTAWHSQSS
jgi:hypothetical protein